MKLFKNDNGDTFAVVKMDNINLEAMRWIFKKKLVYCIDGYLSCKL